MKPADPDLIDIVHRYFAALESDDPEASLAFFADDVIQFEFPNRLVPTGATRNLEALRAAARRGKAVIARQRFEVVNAMVNGHRVACEVRWVGVLAFPIGSLQPGEEMRARFAVFLEFRDGKIVQQRNYDCFDPF
jgi:ketosteroid isomerase-like protein